MAEAGELAPVRPNASRSRLLMTTAYIATAILSLAAWHRPMDMFVASQWRYGYGVGLMRRGLWGSLLDVVGAGSATSVIVAATALFVGITMVGSWLLASVTVDHGRIDPTRVAVAMALALSPAGFPFLAANFGRFDTPALLLMLMAVAIVATGTSAIHVGAAAALLALGVLTHEAALLATAVWAAVWIGGRVASARTRYAGVWAGASCLALPVGVAVALQRPSMPVHAFEEWLAARTDWPHRRAFCVPRSAADSFMSIRPCEVGP